MSEETASSPIDQFTEDSREQIATAQESATDLLSSAAGYIKEHPWTAAAGVATVLGAAVLAFAPRRKPEPVSMVKAWIDEAYAKLPTRRDVDKVAHKVGLTDFLREAGKKLHLLPGH